MMCCVDVFLINLVYKSTTLEHVEMCFDCSLLVVDVAWLLSYFHRCHKCSLIFDGRLQSGRLQSGMLKSGRLQSGKLQSGRLQSMRPILKAKHVLTCQDSI